MGLVGWKYKREIQLINTTSFNLENYIVGISLDSSNFDFSKARFDGSDIRFIDSDGVTLLDYYVEDYDYNNQKATIYVKVPLIPANQTKSIYMYYGNMNTVSQSDQSIMNSGFQYNPDPFNDGSCLAFYPLDGNTNDYSGNGHHGTWYGNEQYDTGKFGQGALITTNDTTRILLPDTFNVPLGGRSGSISAWIKVLAFKNSGSYVNIATGSGSYTGSDFSQLNICINSNQIYGTLRDDSNSGLPDADQYKRIVIGIFTPILGEFYHVVVTWDAENGMGYFYVNGNLVGSHVLGTAGFSPNNGVNFSFIGNHPNGWYNDVMYDQIRIFNRALTEDEISLLSTYIPSTILDEVQVKSRASGVIVDINGNPIINTPIRIYLLNPDTGYLVDSTDCSTDASWEINDVPAEPGEEVISVFKSNDSSQKLTGASVVVTQEVNE